MNIERIGDGNKWSVESESHPGTYYTVRLRTKLDELGGMYFEMTCDCPSRKHPCKHIEAVDGAYPPVDDQAGERTY